MTQKRDQSKPAMVRKGKVAGGKKPNTCRFCAGSKFC